MYMIGCGGLGFGARLVARAGLSRESKAHKTIVGARKCLEKELLVVGKTLDVRLELVVHDQHDVCGTVCRSRRAHAHQRVRTTRKESTKTLEHQGVRNPRSWTMFANTVQVCSAEDPEATESQTRTRQIDTSTSKFSAELSFPETSASGGIGKPSFQEQNKAWCGVWCGEGAQT